MVNSKIFKGVLHNVTMKRGGVFAYSGISLDQLNLNTNDSINNCCNLIVTSQGKKWK